MAHHNDTEKFLQALFQGFYPRHTLFAYGFPPNRTTRKLEDIPAGTDAFFSVGLFPDDGIAIRNTKRIRGVRVLVVDDVGTKISTNAVAKLGTPTGIVLTSPGNCQYSWRLSRVITDYKVWMQFIKRVEAVIGGHIDGPDMVHLFRLPMGCNTKPGRGGAEVRRVEVNPEAVLNIDTLTSSGTAAPPVSEATSSLQIAGHPVRRIKYIRELGRLLPNPASIDRREWLERMFQFAAVAMDKEEARAAVHEWSQRYQGTGLTSGVAYDAEYTDKTWDGMKEPEKTSGLLLLRDCEAADPEAFARLMCREAAYVFNDGIETPEVPPGKGTAKFKRGEKKQILSLAENAKRGISGLGIKCTYDEFHHRIYIREIEVTDPIVLLLRNQLTQEYGKEFAIGTMWEAVLTLAHENKFNPVCEMLSAAETLWDGVRRLDRLGPDYFNTPDTPYARAAFRKMLIAAVRRARQPGCKFDQILVLESPEGWNKSTAWMVLAGEGNFSDESILGKQSREVQEQLADIWIHENSELSGLSRAEVEHVKSFASRQNDRARPAYGRVLINQPRQSIEVGTTNAAGYLLSLSGNRRFWTFEVTQSIDVDRLSADRLQLWGEAATAESEDETLVLDKKLWTTAAIEQEKRRVIDPWEDELANLRGHMAVSKRNGKDFITRVGVHEFLRQRNQVLTLASGKRIAEIMRKLGWEDCRYSIDNVATRGFEKENDSTDVDGVMNVSPENLF